VNRRRIWEILFIVIIFIGIAIILNSVEMGMKEASEFVRRENGMDTSKYFILLQELIQKNRVLGIIISLLGGIGFFYKNKGSV
jgi:drug/metabolite transporter (DMT)-like permease